MGAHNNSNDKPLILAVGDELHSQFLRCYKNPEQLILARELNTLFETLLVISDATLLLDLSLFNCEVDHPAIETIFQKASEHRVLIYTCEQEEATLYTLFEQGARGFCHPRLSDELLVKAIAAVEDGELWIGRKLLGYFVSRLILGRTRINCSAPDEMQSDSKLTLRESEVMSCVARGKCDKLIARELNISPNTVKNHLRHIFRKLEIADRFQLALIYHGIKIN